jgi:hypothetical protein
MMEGSRTKENFINKCALKGRRRKRVFIGKRSIEMNEQRWRKEVRRTTWWKREERKGR